MLSKNYRLTKQNVGRVFKKGRGVAGPFLRIKVMPNRTDHSRFSVTCSKKLAPLAVTRNRFRRKTYTILSEIIPKNNVDITINYQKLPEEKQIKLALLDIFHKSGIM